MGQSVLVFVSHSSEDKESLIEPIVKDLEDCKYSNIWGQSKNYFAEEGAKAKKRL